MKRCPYRMNPPDHRGRSAARLLPALLLLAALGAFAGCAGEGGYGYASYSTGPDYYAYPDNYVYYPAYGVYYSERRHDYIYRDHDRWVHHREAPHDFRRDAPSVRMDWHDSPEKHHAEVERRYPRTWHPAATEHHDEHAQKADHDHDKKKKREQDHDDRDNH